MRRSAESGVLYPGSEAVTRPVQPGGRQAAPPRQLGQLVPAPQTLVQPEVSRTLVLPQEIPIPAFLMWSPENTPAREIVAPPPQEAPADVRPSFDVPNHELNSADLRISATAFTTETPSLPPSTTSPVVVRGPEPVKRVPEMASQTLATPSPARVISISDLHMKEGSIALPPTNQTPPASSSGLPAPGHTKDTSKVDTANTAGKQDGSGAGPNPDDAPKQEAAASGPPGQSVAKSGSSLEAGVGSTSGSEPAYDRIALPKDGQFGVVVVESSLADEYPETAGLSIKTFAYTVYLHVGLAKSWTLQYSLPRAAEAAADNATRPDAPWPYAIVRPHLAPGESNADPIMVHGFVNAAGRFEQLAVVFPLEFAGTTFLLNALQQWQFRPATQHGHVTTVEVLLIIPEQPE